MSTLTPHHAVGATPSDAGKARLLAHQPGPLFIADWSQVVFIHYEVDPVALQQVVPFTLDLFDGKAYISLVAFTMHHMRVCVGDRTVEWKFAPFAHQPFLNVRAYVTHRDEPGIYFLAEWVPSRLNTFLGRRTFGLPYRLGTLQYDHHHDRGVFHGKVTDAKSNHALQYESVTRPATQYRAAVDDSLDLFLLERYSAFTDQRATHRVFHVWHEPWQVAPIDVTVTSDALLTHHWPWMRNATLIGAHETPGVTNVWMGRPLCIAGSYTTQPRPAHEKARA